MKAAILVRRGQSHQSYWCGAMASGLHRHGIETYLCDDPEKAIGDLVVCWGWRFGSQVKSPVLVMEQGYIDDRSKYASCGFDGLNGKARFPKSVDVGSRWRKLFAPLMQRWRDGGEYVLLCGQVPGDMSIAGANHESWLKQVSAELMSAGEQVLLRRHPQHIDCGRPLAADLANARYVVTYNSNSGVDAILAGVPVVAFDPGSMAWDVAGHALGEVVKPDRTHWAHDLAYCQWTINEIASGEAWEHLQRCV